MNKYPTHVKNHLLAAISQIPTRKDEFAKQLGRDFSHNRKISMDNLLFFLDDFLMISTYQLAMLSAAHPLS